ncbi:MAG TPA: hypothetical protein VKO63_00830 [Chitinispirillaceae bacterium]|nr:hypothetical protein [Chitinispirillaceae bacterium]
MLLSTVLVKIVGGIFLVWTIFSIYKHFKNVKNPPKSTKDNKQSTSEQFLNNTLLYLWLTFMIVFSVGMMVNN